MWSSSQSWVLLRRSPSHSFTHSPSPTAPVAPRARAPQKQPKGGSGVQVTCPPLETPDQALL